MVHNLGRLEGLLGCNGPSMTHLFVISAMQVINQENNLENINIGGCGKKECPPPPAPLG